MSEKKILQIFQKCGALLEGHFQLSSGLHSSLYLQCALVLQYPRYGSLLGKELAKKFFSQKIDVVIGPAIGGIIIAYEVAKFLNVQALFSERQRGKMLLRRGFKINKGEKVLLIEDVLTTGGSLKEVIDLVKKEKGEIGGIGAIVDRSDKNIFFERENRLVGKYNFLLKLPMKTFSPINCPFCKQSVPLIKPGSKP